MCLFQNNTVFVCLFVFCLILKNKMTIFLGGQGGLGGRGARCKRHGKWCRYPCSRRCKMKDQTAQAPRGPPGEKGHDGQS